MPNPLTRTQQQALDTLCDLMIPASPDGVMPAASSLDLFETLDPMSPEQVTLLEQGLNMLEETAQRTYQRAFGRLDTSEASKVADAVRTGARRFFQLFTVQNVARYFQHKQVLPLIGLEARPPWPLGNRVAPGDWSLLDAVRERTPIYRQV